MAKKRTADSIQRTAAAITQRIADPGDLWNQALALTTPAEQIIKQLDDMLLDFHYDIKRTKSPRKLRTLLSSIKFFNSIRTHLQIYSKVKEVQHG